MKGRREEGRRCKRCGRLEADSEPHQHERVLAQTVTCEGEFQIQHRRLDPTFLACLFLPMYLRTEYSVYIIYSTSLRRLS